MEKGGLALCQNRNSRSESKADLLEMPGGSREHEAKESQTRAHRAEDARGGAGRGEWGRLKRWSYSICTEMQHQSQESCTTQEELGVFLCPDFQGVCVVVVGGGLPF